MTGLSKTPIQTVEDAIALLKRSNQKVSRQFIRPSIVDSVDAAQASVDEALLKDPQETRELLCRLLHAVYMDWHTSSEVRARFAMRHQPASQLERAAVDMSRKLLGRDASDVTDDGKPNDCIRLGED